MNEMRKKSFTLVEIIIIIIILAILFGAGVSRITELSKGAESAVEAATVRTIKSGVQTYYYESMVKGRSPPYPSVLDDAPDGSFAGKDNPFFTAVVSAPGVMHDKWYKVDSNTYRGPSGGTYNYNSNAGEFVK